MTLYVVSFVFAKHCKRSIELKSYNVKLVSDSKLIASSEARKMLPEIGAE